ncbi:MAG TPA: thioesterase family protein [Solirubrobacterales bacterium]|nr:thioesterase family protein [Solirubrobacterales bacterium]
MPATSHRSFAADTAVVPAGAGRWQGAIGSEWFGPPGPNGGFIAALILRAIRAEAGDPGRLPRSLTVHYLRPPVAGEAEIEVTVERAGRSATTCSARLLQDGRAVTLALCVLTEDYEPAQAWELPPPEVPPAERVEVLPTGPGAPPIFERFENRTLFGSPPFTGGEEAVAGGWLQVHGDEEMSAELLALYADAWWPAPFSVMTAFAPAPTLELTVHFRARPDPADTLALVRFRSEASIDGLVDEAGEVWDRSGRLLAQSRQLALLRRPP